jgi:hypothetical protein
VLPYRQGFIRLLLLTWLQPPAANGKLEMLQRKGEETPQGWLQDSEGHPTVDAHALKTGGALLPLGGDREHGSHKGYALGAIVDIFSGVLSGANYGPWVPPFPAYIPMPQNMPGKGLGPFFRGDANRCFPSGRGIQATYGYLD